MKKLFLLIICIAIVAAPGCSGGKKTKKQPTGNSSPSQKIAPSAKDKSTQIIDQTIDDGETTPKGIGTISGSIIITDMEDRKGNLYIFILDDSKMPEKIVVLAATFINAESIGLGRTPYTLTNVPEGTWSVLAVWDTDVPHCKVTDTYCEVSAKDAIGMSANLVTVTSGAEVQNADVAVFF